MILSFAANANEYVDVSSNELLDITKHIGIKLTDNIDKYNPAQNSFPEFFKTNNQDEIRIGYTNQELWGRINLINKSNVRVSRVFFFDTPLSGIFTFYVDEVAYSTGSSIPLHKRLNQSIYPVLDLDFAPGESKIIYFKRRSHHVFGTKGYLGTQYDFYEFKTSKENNYRYYAGAILALIFYNMMLVVFFKDRKYLLYCLFAGSFLVAVLNLHGVLDYVDVFQATTFSHYLIVTTSLALIMALLFGYRFLEFQKYLPEFILPTKCLVGFAILPIIICVTPLYNSFIYLYGVYIDFFIVVSLFFLIVSGVTSSYRGAPLGSVYIVSWTFIFSGAVLYFGFVYGFFPKIFITENGFLLGNIFEMIVLSLGLGYQVAILDKEMRETLIKARGKEKYQQLLRTISHDVVNSLQVIIMSNKRLKKSKLEEKTLKVCDKIDRATTNITEILDQVKVEEKLASDRASITLEPVNIHEIINNSLFIFEDKLLDKNLIVNTKIAPGAETILAEKITLKNNVIGNILSNAIKFSYEGTQISITSEKLGADKVKLTFKDNGVGFSQEATDYLNNKVNVMVSTKGTKGESGTGFGLRIIKSYMNVYHGSLHTFNNNGAVFELIFNKV